MAQNWIEQAMTNSGEVEKANVGRLVRTKRQPLSSLRVNSSADNEHNIANVEVPVFSGQMLDGDKRASNAGTIAFDVVKMTEIDPAYASATNKGPVVMHTESDGTNKSVYFEMDLTAVARKSFDEKQQMRKEKGLSYSDKTDDVNRNRIDLTQTFTTTEKGVGGVSVAGVTKNVATMAAGMYILNAGEKTKTDPSVGAYSKETIDTVSKLYAKEYAAFMKDAIEKGSKGVPTLDKDKNPVKGKTVDGTSFNALKNYGIKAVEKDGAMTLVAKGPYNALEARAKDPENTLGKALAAASKAFNVEFNRKVNATFAEDKNATPEENKAAREARNLANAIGVNAYPVVPRDENGRKLNMTVIQPAMTCNTTPFASNLTKAISVATHSYTMGEKEDATPADVYGQGVLDKANEMLSYGGADGKPERTRDEAKKEQTEQLQAICKEAKIKYEEAPEAKETDKQVDGTQMGE